MIITKTTDADGNIVRDPFSWSFSKLRNFETCPRQYNEIEVLKNFQKEESTELREGFAVHKALANRLKNGVPLPPTMPYETWANYVLDKDTPYVVEEKLAITEKFKSCSYFDKQKPVWLRTVADVLLVGNTRAHIIDWKTGKIKPEMDQLMLIATCTMVHYPKVFDITAELVWLGFNTKTTMECTVKDIAEFWNDGPIFERVDKLQAAHETGIFPPKKSGLCRNHCAVTSCEFNGQ